MNLNVNYQPYSVLFTGYREDLRLADSVVRSVRNMGLISNTAVDIRLNQVKYANKEKNFFLKLLYKFKYKRKFSRIEKVSEKIENRISNLRSDYSGFYPRYDQFIQKLKSSISKHKVANCGEQAMLAQEKLLLEGKQANLISFTIKNMAGNGNKNDISHAFVVLGLKSDANITNPSTWGRQAIIVDPWSGIAKPVHEGIREIKRTFRISEKNEPIPFEISDLF